MKHPVWVFLIMGSLSIVSINSANAGYYSPGPTATIIPEKMGYQIGEEVTLTIDYPFEINNGDTIFLQVINGGYNGKTVYHAIQPLLNKTTIIKFNLPDEKQEFDRYLIQAQVQQPNNQIQWITGAWIFSKEGAQDAKISDFSIDKNEVRPGDVIHIMFQVKDGAGNVIPWAEAQIGLCKDVPKEPSSATFTPYIINKLEELERKQPGVYQYYCTINYGRIYTSTDAFDIKFRVHDTVNPGNYKLVIFAREPYNSEFTTKEVSDIVIKGDPIPPKTPDTFVFMDHQWPNPESPFDGFFTSGKTIAFYPRQVSEGAFSLDEGQQVAKSGIAVQIFAVDPYGNVVYNNQTAVDENGNFDKMAFSITDDMKPGFYDIYYNVTKDGNFLFNQDYGGMSAIEIVNNQKFAVDAEGKSFDVAFQSLDLTASNISFDQAAKTLSFDIKKVDGKYNDRYFSRESLQTGQATVIMEKPLLTGPFIVQLNDKPVFTKWYPSNMDLQLNIEQAYLEHINESGRLTIIGTHVVPEFPVAALVLIASIIASLIVTRTKIAPK